MKINTCLHGPLLWGLVLAGVLASAGVASAQLNLISNGDFESNGGAAGSDAAGWTKDGAYGVYQEAGRGNAHSGTWAYVTGNGANTGAGVYQTLASPLVAGAYTLTFYANPWSPESGLDVRVGKYEGGGYDSDSSYSLLPLTVVNIPTMAPQNWEQQSYTFTALGGEDTVYFGTAAAGQNDGADIDDVGLTQVVVGVVITSQPADAAAFVNTTAAFTVGASVVGAPTLAYQWQRNGVNLPAATGASYTTPTLVLTDNGDKFQCVLTAGGITVTSRVAALTVLQREAVPGSVAWLNFDNTLSDQAAIPQAHDGTFVGNAAFDPTVPNATAGTASVNFLGDAWVELANSSDLNMDTGMPFTIAAWIKTDFTDGYRVIVAKSPPGVTGCGQGHTTALLVDAGGRLAYDAYCVGENRSSTVVRNGVWTHVAVTYDGTNYRLFINGRQDVTTGAYNYNGGANQGGDTSWVFTVGATLNADYPGGREGIPNGAFRGNIDEVAFWSLSLTPAQILGVFGEGLPKVSIIITQQPGDALELVGGTVTLTVAGTAVGTAAPLEYQWRKNGVNIPGATSASYTTPALVLTNNGDKFQCVLSAAGASLPSREAVVTVLEPQAVPGPVAWLNFDNTLADQAAIPQAHDGSFVGNAAFDPTIPNATAGTASVNLLGDGHVELANSADLNMDTGVPFTIAAWIKTDFTDGTHVILAKSPAGVSSCSDGKHTPALFVDGGGKLVYDVYCVGANTSSTVVRNGAWTHVAVTYDGTKYRFYINGQQDVTTGAYNPNGGANEAGDVSWVFTIGDGLNLIYPVGAWVGNIDEVAFWNSPLTPAQILGVFGQGLPKVSITITQQPGDALALVGGTVTLSVAGTAVGTAESLKYQWQKNGTPIAGATEATYTTPALTAADNGARYRGVVSAGGASAASREAIVMVIDTSASYPSAVLADQPLVYYRFDEAVGATTAYDASGHGQNGTYANVSLGTASFASALGNAAAFNNNGSVAVPALGSYEAVTIEVWVKPSARPNSFNGLYLVDGWSLGWVHYEFMQDGRLQYAMNGPTPNDLYFGNGTVFALGQWQHVVTTYDSASGQVAMYVNGQLLQTQAFGGPIPADLAAAHIGGWNGNSRFFSGLMDEFAVYGSVLPADRVSAHYAAATLPTLEWVKAGNQLTFSWNGTGFKLEQNSEPANPSGWTDVPDGGASPVSVTVGAGNRFFRLVKP